MEEYKPNSNKYKKEQQEMVKSTDEKRANKVVTGKVITKKEGFFSKLTKGFISDDAKNVKSYVFGEVLIPAIKKAISDIVTDGIDIILYGESRKGGRRSVADRVSYRSYYDNKPSYRDTASRYDDYSYDNIILETRADAEEVLARMDEMMDTYGLVRVADFKDLVGITGSYTDNKYGWTNIRSAEVVRVRDGYTIRMPRAVPID